MKISLDKKLLNKMPQEKYKNNRSENPLYNKYKHQKA